MDYTPQLAFLRQFLSAMNISSCIVEDPLHRIPPQIDLRLRAELFCLDNYTDFLENSMNQAKDRTLYRFYDEYFCSYIFLQLPDNDGYFFIGPYLLSIPSADQIREKAKALQLSEEQVNHMQFHYTTLPLVEDENLLLTLANTFATHLWGSPEAYTMEYVDYAIPDRHAPVPAPFSTGTTTDAGLNLRMLEESYSNEGLLMEAVSKGKLHLLTGISATVFNNGAEARLRDSLRDRKNYLVILKTLLRKAAEQGGVHPMHIHRLTSDYALRIENIRTIKESFSLQSEMIRDFCLLVKQYSLQKYSYYVGQAITLVQYDLTADLRLCTIAQKLNVNSSYLSDLFHREYGCTLTTFINRQRMEHAITLLRRNDRPVQEIATECGIQDVNYFIKLFKKHTGFTPNRYRQQLGASKTGA